MALSLIDRFFDHTRTQIHTQIERDDPCAYSPVGGFCGANERHTNPSKPRVTAPNLRTSPYVHPTSPPHTHHNHHNNHHHYSHKWPTLQLFSSLRLKSLTRSAESNACFTLHTRSRASPNTSESDTATRLQRERRASGNKALIAKNSHSTVTHPL